MKKQIHNDDVQEDAYYKAKVNGKVVTIQILHKLSLGKGWSAKNLETGRRVHIRSAQRLRRVLTTSELLAVR